MIAPTPTPSTITRPPATPAVSFGFAQELPGISATTPVSIPLQGWQAAPTAPTAPPLKQTAAPSGAPSGGDGGDDSNDDKKGSPDRDGSPPSKRGRSRSSTPKKERPLQSDGEQCLRTCGIHESCTESDFFAYAANHLLGRKLWRQTLDGSDGKRLLNCLSRNRNLVEQFSGEEQTVGPGEMGGNWPRGQDFHTICKFVLQVAHTENIAVPDHSRLWNALGCLKDSPAAQFFQHHVPNYLSMPLDEIFHRGYQKFGKSHSCLAMNQRKRELLLTSSSFHDLVFKTSDPDSKTTTMVAMFNLIKLILSCNHNVAVDAPEAIQIFCRVMPEAMKEELKSKLNPSEVGDVYKLPMERFEEAIRLVRPVSKADMRQMVKQQAHARRTNVASAPAETLKQHLATESSDCDQGWSTESVSPPLASAPAESTLTYEWTMLDTAPRPRHTSSAPAKRDSTASATIRTEPIMSPYPSTGPRLIQVAAYDVARESQTKDGKPPAELPEFIQKELLHPKTCEYCRRLGMVQTLLPKPNRPLEPSEQISWGKNSKPYEQRLRWTTGPTALGTRRKYCTDSRVHSNRS